MSWAKLCFEHYRRLMPCVVMLQALVAPGTGHAQQSTAPISISVDQFQLLTQGKEFFLQPAASETRKRIRIPREWLIPPTQKKEEEEAPYLPFITILMSPRFPSEMARSVCDSPPTT